MTHSLHRTGDIADLGDDFVILLRTTQGVNKEGSGPKIREFVRLLEQHGAVNLSTKRGPEWPGTLLDLDFKALSAYIQDGSPPGAVLTVPEELIGFLADLADREFGISVVVSGVYGDVVECCHKAGLTPHTANSSLGFWGRTELLPDGSELDLTTMCGHGMIPVSLVRDLVSKVRRGRLTIDEAVTRLGRPCVCGHYNPVRARRLVEVLLASDAETERNVIVD